MMVSILSQIVEFRNGESGSHVLHINTITGMLLERLMQKTDQYHLLWSDRFMITNSFRTFMISGKIGIDGKNIKQAGKTDKRRI